MQQQARRRGRPRCQDRAWAALFVVAVIIVPLSALITVGAFQPGHNPLVPKDYSGFFMLFVLLSAIFSGLMGMEVGLLYLLSPVRKRIVLIIYITAMVLLTVFGIQSTAYSEVVPICLFTFVGLSVAWLIRRRQSLGFVDAMLGVLIDFIRLNKAVMAVSLACVLVLVTWLGLWGFSFVWLLSRITLNFLSVILIAVHIIVLRWVIGVIQFVNSAAAAGAMAVYIQENSENPPPPLPQQQQPQRQQQLPREHQAAAERTGFLQHSATTASQSVDSFYIPTMVTPSSLANEEEKAGTAEESQEGGAGSEQGKDQQPTPLKGDPNHTVPLDYEDEETPVHPANRIQVVGRDLARAATPHGDPDALVSAASEAATSAFQSFLGVDGAEGTAIKFAVVASTLSLGTIAKGAFLNIGDSVFWSLRSWFAIARRLCHWRFDTPAPLQNCLRRGFRYSIVAATVQNKSWKESCDSTWEAFDRRDVWAIVGDDCSESWLALSSYACGSLISIVLLGLLQPYENWLFMAFIVFVYGYHGSATVLAAVRGCIASIMVAFAENPALVAAVDNTVYLRFVRKCEIHEFTQRHEHNFPEEEDFA